MKATFDPKVEKGRVHTGELASKPGEPFGFFHVKQPKNRLPFKIMVGSGMGWDHVSVSLPHRCPTWEEMCWVKDLFWPSEETVLQYHPPASQAVNLHKYCLHLWRPINQAIPLPPVRMV
jgi:hypothetical protein